MNKCISIERTSDSITTSNFYELIEKILYENYFKESSTQHDDDLIYYPQYLRIMTKLDWPAYLNIDPTFHKRVIEQFELLGSEGAILTIFDYYDALCLKNIENEFSKSEIINKDRLPLLREALLLYQLGYYYGTVSILITQINGIASDIQKYLESNHISYTPETEKYIQNTYNSPKDSDKVRVSKVVYESKQLDEYINEYDCLLNYLRYRIFASGNAIIDFNKHVHRHSLCHGSQINYGTREHALKVIICIEALIEISAILADNLEEDSDVNE